jgi:NAD(P)-dependent dehydrogenase (short-subunit alcohol dehydrogenase family)
MTDVSFDLTGRRALVTGSSRGIGRALALGLARAGADVAVHAASRIDAAEAVAAEIRAGGRRAAAFGCDLTRPDAIDPFVDVVTAELGGIDILVVNASVQIRARWDEIDRADFDTQVAANLFSTFRLMQRTVPAMRAQGWGRVLTIGSIQQWHPHPMMAVYAATKSAVASLVRSVARDVAADGVTVNNLAPGVVATDRTEGVLADDAYRASVLARIPVGFVGEPSDCVGLALLLASPAGRYITGADIPVDGGEHVV